MSARSRIAPAPPAPVWGELRYSTELARLLGDATLRAPRRRAEAPAVLLIPGFMAGDASLMILRAWLRRRGHEVALSGIVANVDCAGATVARMQPQLRELARASGGRVVVIGQSRGGALARALAVREPDSVRLVVTLGSPVLDPLAVNPAVIRAVCLLARLGDLRIPGLFSTGCRDGACCAEFHEQLTAPLPADVHAVAIHSRSDGIVDWRACLDPHVDQVEVDSSHCGMSVHPEVYRVLDDALDS
jgi:pimeloyl-ACP methyl ester carboxylesterase